MAFCQHRVSLPGMNETAERSGEIGHRTGSTDMGDISHIMPAVHPYAAGATGTGHGNDYQIKDYETAVLLPAKVMAMTVIDLLADGAVEATRVLAENRPRMTRDGYLSYQRGVAQTIEFDGGEF